uniref:MYND-type domain-containing protein n=1 Tax=Tetradesmus obliquus TaxID=3088 RepID=A0A383WD05_TETOB|eukprot:jgi/Sobl393_1/165/SZX74904.1
MVAVDTARKKALALVPAELMRTAVSGLAQLLQQMQACGPVLAAPATGRSPPSRSSSSSSGSSSSQAYQAYGKAQVIAVRLLFSWSHLPEGQLEQEVAATLQQLLRDVALQELLLQQLTVNTMLMHRLRGQQQQQQQQQQAQRSSGSGDSSSSSQGDRQQRQQRQQPPIPACHEGMRLLLPGGQTCLDAAAAAAVEAWRNPLPEALEPWLDATYKSIIMLGSCLQRHLRHCTDHSTPATAAAAVPLLVLSPAAVRLVLELQLLVADVAQRQQQHRPRALSVLYECNTTLCIQVQRYLAVTGSSCLPPEVLQQAGLQLLQALAAPLQKLQVHSRRDPHAKDKVPVESGAYQQLYALRAAAAGFASADATATEPVGQLPDLAAAHPEAYCSLIDCCVRSPLLTAADMLAAAQLLEHAAAAVLCSVEGKIVEWLLKATAKHSCTVFLSSSSSSSASSFAGNGSSSQAAASAVLLLVVLARSVVQLADAVEAAGFPLLQKSWLARPAYNMAWTPCDGMSVHFEGIPSFLADLAPSDFSQTMWQRGVMLTMWGLWQSMRLLGLTGADAQAAAASGAQQLSSGQLGDPAASSSNSHGRAASTGSSSACNSSSQQVYWGYLLHLRQSSHEWAAAVSSFEAGFGKLFEENSEPSTLAEQGGQLFTESLLYRGSVELCRALAAAAPLPVVCNSLNCQKLAGVSEAAAVGKACAGCMCRYCSPACQTDDWRRHKRACKRMAAAGEACG